MLKTVTKNNHRTKKLFFHRLLSLVVALVLISTLFPASFPVSAASNEETIYNYLTGTMHLNQAAASGVLANIFKESSFNPNATGDGGTSYGICQWHNTRWTALKNYCNNNGYDWTTLNGQLHYLEYELKNSYPGVYSTLTSVANTADGAYNAGYTWCYSFEIPANKESVSVERGNLAKNTYWPKYGTTAQEAWLWPVAASKTISSNFGMRYIDGEWKMHTGIDISCSIGTAVRAAKSGVIYDCYFGFGDNEHDWSDTMRSFGNYVAIKHTDGTYSLYAHLKQQQLFSKNDAVSQGQTIAYSGNSGASSGPHCHFQATKNPSPSWGNAANLINTMPTEECISQNGITVNNTYVEASGYSTTRINYSFSAGEHTHDHGTYVFDWTVHPHYKCYRCSICGTIWEDRTQTSYWDTCETCLQNATSTEGKNLIHFDTNGGELGEYISTKALDGLNVGRAVGYLVAFTDGGTTTTTNQYGKEVAVDYRGKVIAKRGYGDENGLLIPEGGFVLSGQHSGNSEDGSAFVQAIMDLPEAYIRIDYFTKQVWVYDNYPAYIADKKYVGNDETYTSLPIPRKTGYYFNGWYTDTGVRTLYNTPYQSDYLTANWTVMPNSAAYLSYNGHFYEVYDCNLSWLEAKAFCESKGGYLACITNVSEQQAVFTLAKNCQMNLYYLGGSDVESEGNWKWLSGEPFDYENFDKGAPEPNGGTTENYLEMIMVDNGTFKQAGEWVDCPVFDYNNFYDISNTGFICEYNKICNHSYLYSVTTTPTTTSGGVLTGTCSRCGAQMTVTLPKLSTTDYNYTVTKAPTCTATGTGRYTWKTTTYGTFYFDVTIPKTAHNYQTVITPPTCTTQGYTTHTCSVCGDSYKDNYTAALGHNYSYSVTTAPTTSAAGVLTGTCSRCNVQTSVALPKLTTTDYTYTVTKAATCTATGTGRYTWKTTTYGSFYFDVTIPKTAHNYQNTVTPPTCTTQGYTTHTCSACGDTYKDSYTDALGHAWDNGVVTKPATDTETGTMLYTCTRCGATRTEVIPVNGHVHSYTPTVIPPTCTEQGYTLYTCSCGHSYKDAFTAPLGHSFGSWVVTKTPTCTAAGTETRTCSRCGATESRPVSALGHAESDWIVDRNPSCTASGYKHTECTRCGMTLNTAIIPAKGHTETEWITDRAPTCTASGTRHTECSVCGATIQTGAIAALGHAWDNGVVTKPATRTETGTMLFTCTRCGETRTEVIPKLDGPVNPFVDVSEGKYYYEPVLWAVYHEPQITNGTDATHFSPDKTCNRGQVVTFLWRAYGCPEPTQTSHPFTDVKESAFYYKAMLWAVEQGITAGTSATTFGPNRDCTRGQVVTFLWRAAGQPEPKSTDCPFTDVKTTASYYKAVLWAVENGVTSGTSATAFSPSRTCNRAQVVTFLYRAVTKE